MIGEQMEHMTKTNKDKQIKRKIETSPVLEHRLQQGAHHTCKVRHGQSEAVQVCCIVIVDVSSEQKLAMAFESHV